MPFGEFPKYLAIFRYFSCEFFSRFQIPSQFHCPPNLRNSVQFITTNQLVSSIHWKQMNIMLTKSTALDVGRWGHSRYSSMFLYSIQANCWQEDLQCALLTFFSSETGSQQVVRNLLRVSPLLQSLLSMAVLFQNHLYPANAGYSDGQHMSRVPQLLAKTSLGMNQGSASSLPYSSSSTSTCHILMPNFFTPDSISVSVSIELKWGKPQSF